MRSESRDSAGFSLIELMVSVAVFGLITAQLLVVFSNQKRVYSSNERALDVQEQARLTLDLVAFDTRMGGFMVPRWAAVSSVDGGTDAADRFCVSDASYFDFTGAPSPLDTKAFPFDGAQVTAMSGVKDDIPANGRWGGFFAKPTKQWFREIVAVERLTRDGPAGPKGEGRE